MIMMMQLWRPEFELDELNSIDTIAYKYGYIVDNEKEMVQPL